MLNSFHKTLISAAFFLVFGGIVSFAQPAHKAMERMEQLKKIKLLEILDLDEAQAEKFLIKYNASEKAIEEKKLALDKAIEMMNNRIEEGASKTEIAKVSDQVLALQIELSNALTDKFKNMKSILDEVNFAKFLSFEHSFVRELRKNIMDIMRGKDGSEKGFRKKVK